MDFHHLEYFVEIAKENNITRAAEKLYVSQSAVNQYLLKLEAELGTQLFVRNRRNWKLTEAGEIYLAGCREALLIRQDTYSRIRDITDSRSSTLSVGLTPSRGLAMFTEIYPELHQAFPELTVTPHELDANTQQKAVDRGELDLSFILNPELPSDRHSYIDLGLEEMVVIVPAELDPAASDTETDMTAQSYRPLKNRIQGGWGTDTGEKLPEIDLSVLKGLPFILTRTGSSGSMLRELCNRIFLEADFSPSILMETSSTAHIVSIASVCRCCGIIPRYYMDSKDLTVHYYVLRNHPSWHLYITHRKDAYLTKAAREYIRLAKDYWQRHLIPPQS